MAQRFDLIVHGGTVVTPIGHDAADIGIVGGRIAEIGSLGAADAGARLDARGLHVLPGVIDSQVHFREPGGEHKEDLASGTAAAALGGVTCVFEMPNTDPPTTTAEALADKLARARGRAWVDHAFFIGAAPDNLDHLSELERLPGCCGVKIFMGSSTGSLLVSEDRDIERALRAGRRRVAVHAEDEARLRARRAIAESGGDVAVHPEWRDVECARRATERLLALSARTRRPVHVLHVTTAEEMALLAGRPKWVSVECTPQHLTLEAPDCYRRLGTLAQMNPPIRDARHRAALWQGVADGVVDVIGSDHAPHTREEKARPYPESPSGMPGVQTLLPIMLDHVHAGRLGLDRLVELVSGAPARLYRVSAKGAIRAGFDADLSLVDLAAERRITDDWLASKCGWSPFAGTVVTGWPMATVIRGRAVMRDGELIGRPQGAPVRFEDVDAEAGAPAAPLTGPAPGTK
jgi:dihydroorotase